MKSLLFVTLMSISLTGFTQKLKITEGSLKALKGAKSIKTEFNYDEMSVGKFKTESEYIQKRKVEINEKEPGRGDKWEAAWIADRQDRFEPQFRELFAKHSGMTTADDNAAYTLIFKTTRTEPGFNVGVASRPASIDAEVWIVESSNPSSIVAKISLLNAPGRAVFGTDFETGARLQEAYAKAGKELGAFIVKNAK